MNELDRVKEAINDELDDLDPNEEGLDIDEMYEVITSNICNDNICGNLDCVYCPLCDEDSLKRYMEGLKYE